MTLQAPTIEQLVENVTKGAKWLGEHDADPPGRFYLWWRMGMTAASPMPSQPEEVKAAYAQWFHAYNRWLSLYAELERLAPPVAMATVGTYLKAREEAR